MKLVLLGYKDTDFTAKDGRRVEGKNLYFPIPIDSKYGAGHEGDGKFVATESDAYKELPNLVVGNVYDVDFSNKGRILSVSEAKQPSAPSKPEKPQ